MVNYLSDPEDRHFDCGIEILPAIQSFHNRQVLLLTEVDGEVRAAVRANPPGHASQAQNDDRHFQMDVTPLYTSIEALLNSGLWFRRCILTSEE